MNRERKKGVIYSATLHTLVFLFALFGLPALFPPKPLDEPMAYTVEILPTAAVSNVRPSQEAPAKEEDKQKKPEPKQGPPKPEAEKAKTEPKPAPPVKSESPPPPPKQEEKKKEEEKKKPQEKPKEEKKKEKPKPDELDAILKSLEQPKAEESAPQDTAKDEKASSKSKSRSTNFNPNSPEALSIRDSISNQVYKCWNVPAGALNADKLVILVRVQYGEDGAARTVELAPESKAKLSDPFYRAAADSAMRAVRQCSPLKDMPKDGYHIWQDVEINFNPKDML